MLATGRFGKKAIVYAPDIIGFGVLEKWKLNDKIRFAGNDKKNLYYIVFVKELVEKSFVDKFNQVLMEVHASGKMAEIYKRYTGDIQAMASQQRRHDNVSSTIGGHFQATKDKGIIMAMKNSDASGHHSISKRLSLGLIITLLVVASLSLVVNYIVSSRKARTELEIKSNEYSVALTDALRIPIWDINQETIKAIGESYSQNEFVAQLLIEGQDGLVYFNNEKLDEQSEVSRSKDILHDGQIIGRVHIALASGYYKAVNRQIFWSFSLTIIVMIGALLIMTGILLRQFFK